MPWAPSSCPCSGFPPRSWRCWGVLLAGGPEVLCILAVALLGKDTLPLFHPPGHDRAAPRCDRSTRIEGALLHGPRRHSAELASSLHLRVLPDAHAGRRCAHLRSRRHGLAFVVSVFSWAESSGKRSGASSSTKAGFEFGAGSLPSRNAGHEDVLSVRLRRPKRTSAGSRDAAARSKYPMPSLARLPYSAKMALCGSVHWTTQLPPGTSTGLLRIPPPPAFTRLIATSMSPTLK